MKDYGIDLRWLSVASFEMRFGGTTVVTDPYITDCVGTELTHEAIEACDIICISHTHWDHITDVPALYEKYRPKILLGEMSALKLARWINASPTDIYPMYPDTELDFGEVKIRALYGRHIRLKGGLNDLAERLANKTELNAKYPGIEELGEIGSFEYRNFLFTAPNGTRILVWGNEPNVVQANIVKELKPDIAIIQRSVDEKAALEKARFAAATGAKVLIPHHHDFHGVDDPSVIERFGEMFLELVPDGRFINPGHGEWIHI